MHWLALQPTNDSLTLPTGAMHFLLVVSIHVTNYRDFLNLCPSYQPGVEQLEGVELFETMAQTLCYTTLNLGSFSGILMILF